MSSAKNDSEERKKISKVSIAPISQDAMVVRIRKFSTEVKPENLPQVSSTFQAIVPKPLDPKVSSTFQSIVPKLLDPRVSSTFQPIVPKPPDPKASSTFQSIVPRPHDLNVVEKHKTTVLDLPPKSSKSSKSGRKQRKSTKSESEGQPDAPPCIKHAAENISRKAHDIPSEKINLCNDCSKSMLSYIFLVQDFLDSLAKEIVGESGPKCLQCAREEVRRNVASSSDDASRRANQQSSPEKHVKHSQAGSPSHHPSDRKSQDPGSQRHEPWRKGESHPQVSANQHSPQFAYKVSPPTDSSQGNRGSVATHGGQAYSDSSRPISDSSSRQQQESFPDSTVNQHAPGQPSHQDQNFDRHPPGGGYAQHSSGDVHENPSYSSHENRGNVVAPHFERHTEASSQSDQSSHSSSNYQNIHSNDSYQPMFQSPNDRTQPHYETPPADYNDHHNNNNDNNPPPQHSPSLYSDDLDGIISTLSNFEREVYDNARNGAGWESLTETQRSSGSTIASEAFVTSCRNNAEAIGCLVVGTSLLLCRTSRTLCVLVSDGVSSAFKNALSTVFQLVQNVRSLDSLGTTKLALLEQPELGITFEKLNVWRLTQFSKCVYLNPDTLVIQNCDDLFSRKELSAVPDIGWPDCFNSGVFVFRPSVHTFWALMEHADKQGSYDGGDQGLLNSYFNSWSSDISMKLSFVYNLMANVSYTYTPAFKQFGRNVKIVQFHGSFKPWHVKFFTKTGQVSPSSPVHPTYIQFVHIWLNIFRISVLRLMSPEIQSYAASHETICAVEILRFFPLPAESEADFYLTPPSVRLRRAQQKLERPTSLPITEAQRRKSAEYSQYVSPDDDEEAAAESATSQAAESTARDGQASESTAVGTESESTSGESADKTKDSVSDEVFAESDVVKKVNDPNAIPGAEVGDYHGMKAWEQGRMDYEGTDKSDNVLKRLNFLMSRPANK